MKAIVEEGCISCGACVGAEVTAENEEEAKAARDSCPVSVIDIR